MPPQKPYLALCTQARERGACPLARERGEGPKVRERWLEFMKDEREREPRF